MVGPAKRIGVACIALAFGLVASPAAAAPHYDGQFKVTGSSASNVKLAAGPDGNMWMTLSGSGKDVARIGPDGTVQEFDLAGTNAPAGIAAGPDGNLWMTQNGGVVSFSPSNPEGTEADTAIGAIKNDASIVTGPDGQMWVATDGAAVHFPPANPAGSESILVAGLAPHDIDVAGPLLVIADSANTRIVTLTTSGTQGEVPMLGAAATSQGVAGSPGGQFAFSQSTSPEGLGLVTPPGAPKTVEMEGDPFGVALGSDGAYWFAMSAADNLQRLTPDGQATPLGGFPAKFFPRQIAAGPGNTLWVAMEIPGENVVEVARISGLEPPVKPAGGQPPAKPETKISKGPKRKVKTKGKRAKVSFRFNSTSAGATFECALTKKRKKGKKPAKPRFAACRSPKAYSLKPGRYTFSVRAVSAGLVDDSPATQRFRVVHVAR